MKDFDLLIKLPRNISYAEWRAAPKYHSKELKERWKLTKTLRKLVYERDGYKCKLCGSDTNLSIDHIIPISKGGKTEINNLQTLCISCNKKKANKIYGKN